jgi:ketosteroid isomerase-like protein
MDAIRSAEAAWLEALAHPERFAASFTEDGSWFPSEAPIAVGRDEIRAYAEELVMLPGFSFRKSSTGAHASAAGDLGYSTGTFEMTVDDESGNPSVTRGKYVTVWRKEPDGIFRVVADIFNSDEPPPEPIQ